MINTAVEENLSIFGVLCFYAYKPLAGRKKLHHDPASHSSWQGMNLLRIDFREKTFAHLPKAHHCPTVV
jgi:hypothetical protein